MCEQIDDIAELRQWANDHELPDSLEALEDFKTYSIPMRYENHPGVDAVVLTSKTQIGWMLQLLKWRQGWVMHIDGKHKLHHGK